MHPATRTYCRTRRAHYDYDVQETIEAGIVLAGHEVKAIRSGRVSLEGARVLVRGGSALLVGATISPYQPSNTPAGYDPTRPRTLLLHQDEIARIAAAERERGLTAIPLSLYDRNGKIKVEVAIARGRRKHDKREHLKRRSMERDAAQTLKRTVRL